MEIVRRIFKKIRLPEISRIYSKHPNLCQEKKDENLQRQFLEKRTMLPGALRGLSRQVMAQFNQMQVRQ